VSPCFCENAIVVCVRVADSGKATTEKYRSPSIGGVHVF
jgi:hypothetical protein